MPAPDISAPPLGEHEIEGGFRRASRGPEPHALTRLRALLLEVAADGGPLLRRGLEGFESWRGLATLCGTEWTSGALGTFPSARVLRRRLRVLGTRPVDLARAAQLPVGTAVHLRGTIQPAPASEPPNRINPHIGYIWSLSAMTTDNVRLTVEEGHDFFLGGEGEETARVIAARGYLINADALFVGERISVFGFTDRAVLPSDGLARTSFGFSVAAGDDGPLLIKRLSRGR